MNNTTTIFKTVLLILLISAVATLTTFAAGEVDPTFNAAVQETLEGSVQDLVVQSDGKLIVGGNFTVAGNSARSNVARLNTDGTVDETFNPPDFNTTGIFGALAPKSVFLYAVAVQSDGKVLVGGDFKSVNNQPSRGIVRLNQDGSLDTTFNVPSFQNVDFKIYEIKIQNNNQIVIGGDFILRQPGVGDRYNLARVNLDGSLDASFFAEPVGIATPRAFVIQPDGKIVVNGTRRLNYDGTLDSSYNNPSINGAVRDIALQADGKILIVGSITSVNGFPQNGISRLNADGTLDTSFNVNGTAAAQPVNGVTVLPDGKIAIGGQFTQFNGVPRGKNARLNSDGTLDMSYTGYNPGGNSVINAVASLGDGRVIIGGADSSGGWDKLARLNTDGTPDTNFKGAIYHRGVVNRVLAQPDGKVLLAGAFRKVNGIARRNFARLNQDGSLDTTFTADASAPGSQDPNAVGYTLALQPDGKILISGTFFLVNGDNTKPYIARVNADGSIDNSFKANLSAQWIDEVAVLPSGKIIIGGNFRIVPSPTNSCVARLNSDGTKDNLFDEVKCTAPSDSLPIVSGLKIQPDGKIVIGGQFTQINGVNRGRIARINADGILDSTFNPPFGANADVYDLALQPDGKILIGGIFSGVNGVNNLYYLARLFTDGTLDTNFAPTPNGQVYAVELQADNKILIGGAFNTVGGISRNKIARINANGVLDNTFGGTGANDFVRHIYSQSDGDILVGGDFTRINGVSRVGVARLLNIGARTRYDFDGDGKADLSVFRPSNGTWYLQQSTNGFNGIAFGASGDIITPADFDGDGKTDIAVFRPSTGYWYTSTDPNQNYGAILFGASGDVPMPGDYDGDGKADLAVFRPSNGVWYIQQSQAGFVGIAFGQNGDKPVAADYDGDGKIDIAVFRPSNSVWYIQQSQAGFNAVVFGAGTDLPVPADYDGDGKANIAVFRPSTGYWYTSTDPNQNYGATLFGAMGDLPVPADYDGDGRADLAVFRPTNGVWYRQRSTAGFDGVLFGISEDKPIPNAFIR